VKLTEDMSMVIKWIGMFTAQCHASAVCALALMAICSSQVDVLIKWLNLYM